MPKIIRISLREYMEFRRDYFKADFYHHKSLRFGQAFLDKFFPIIPDDELWYCTNVDEATDLIFERYVNLD